MIPPERAIVVCVPRERRGRPRAPEPMTSLSTWVPTRVYERYRQMAERQDMSVSELARRVLVIQVKK